MSPHAAAPPSSVFATVAPSTNVAAIAVFPTQKTSRPDHSQVRERTSRNPWTRSAAKLPRAGIGVIPRGSAIRKATLAR